MPYQITWYIPDHILIIRYFGDLTVEELRQSSQESAARLDARPPNAPTRCHIITQATDLETMPPALAAFQNTLKRPHPSVGWICLIGNNSVQSMIASAITQLMGINFKVFESQAAALQFLIERAPTLDGLVTDADLPPES